MNTLWLSREPLSRGSKHKSWSKMLKSILRHVFVQVDYPALPPNAVRIFLDYL